METSYNAGQLVKVVDKLEAQHGLCPSRTEGTVFVADGHSTKEINLEEKSVRVSCDGFQQAFDVALSVSGNLGVTDVKGHKSSFLKNKIAPTCTTLKVQLEMESLAALMVQQLRLSFQNPQGYVLILTVAFFVALVEAKLAT